MYRLKLILLLSFLSSGLAQNWLQTRGQKDSLKKQFLAIMMEDFHIAEEIF